MGGNAWAAAALPDEVSKVFHRDRCTVAPGPPGEARPPYRRRVVGADLRRLLLRSWPFSGPAKHQSPSNRSTSHNPYGRGKGGKERAHTHLLDNIEAEEEGEEDPEECRLPLSSLMQQHVTCKGH